MKRQFTLYDALNAELKLRQRDGLMEPDSKRITQSDCDRNYWRIVQHSEILVREKATLLESLIRTAFDHDNDVSRYLPHFERFCKYNKL